jgi:transcriptional regulator with XRE-family HTH domain
MLKKRSVIFLAASGKTAEVMRKISTAKSVTKMLRETGKEPPLPTVGEYLDVIRREKGLSKEEFFVMGGVSSVYGYEILRGAKSPSRDTLIQFALSFCMSVEETQELLKVGEKAQLYPFIKRDALIIYALTHGLSAVKFNLSAEEHGVLPIGNYR